MNFRDIPISSDAWARREVAALPKRWASRLIEDRAHRELRDGEREANLHFLDLMDRLRAASLPLDATDDDVMHYADKYAREALRHDVPGVPRREAMERFCRARGVEPPAEKTQDGPAILRMACPLWWRRKLRVMHARAVESSAIALGYVGKHADKYVSDESLRRRQQQQRRIRRTLESTEAENETTGQRMTLAQLADCSVARPDIRRGELVTRLKGFEAIADGLGHAALFVTLTCPSRMHPTANGAPNPRYDGTRPDEAQRYLSRVWARVRAELWREDGEKRATKVYGVRIVEPHADGCPHWHLVLWAPEADLYWVKRAIKEHALADSPDEPGAQDYRVRFEAIDKAKGSAVGYVIKYIAKNIDGFRVGDWRVDGDLIGDESINLSDRVQAWAATWRIRMFQQVSGPPVGVWRELRRIKREALADKELDPYGSEIWAAPQPVRDAWLAAQRFDIEHRGEGAEPVQIARRADWAGYVQALGGPIIKRKDRPVTLARKPADAPGRYGDEGQPKPVGVQALGQRLRDFGGIVGRIACGCVARLVQSVRHAWRVIRGRGSEGARSATDSRTRVNNCTAIHKRESWPQPAPDEFHGPPLPEAVLVERYGAPDQPDRGWL